MQSLGFSLEQYTYKKTKILQQNKEFLFNRTNTKYYQMIGCFKIRLSNFKYCFQFFNNKIFYLHNNLFTTYIATSSNFHMGLTTLKASHETKSPIIIVAMGSTSILRV